MSMMTVFVLAAAFVAAFSLFQGIVSMAHGGAEDDRLSTRFMLKRVGWQALAVMFLLLALLSNLK
jgi:hypothetical protein